MKTTDIHTDVSFKAKVQKIGNLFIFDFPTISDSYDLESLKKIAYEWITENQNLIKGHRVALRVALSIDNQITHYLN